jgi:hypothetical protein
MSKGLRIRYFPEDGETEPPRVQRRSQTSANDIPRLGGPTLAAPSASVLGVATGSREPITRFKVSANGSSAGASYFPVWTNDIIDCTRRGDRIAAKMRHDTREFIIPCETYNPHTGVVTLSIGPQVRSTQEPNDSTVDCGVNADGPFTVHCKPPGEEVSDGIQCVFSNSLATDASLWISPRSNVFQPRQVR